VTVTSPEETSSHPPVDDPTAAALRGFGPVGLGAIVVILGSGLLGGIPAALMVLAWRWRTRTPWSELGLVRPKNWVLTAAIGIAFGIAFKFAMKALVMPLLGAPAINPAYHYLAGNSAAVPGFVLTLIFSAGIGEEIFYRGYLFERLGAMLGRNPAAQIATLLIASALFGAAHLREQGLPGAEQAFLTGLTFGAIFLRTRQLPMNMFAHAAFDLTALWMIYWNLESRIAHLVFH
jgi:membrane protease YdiL (CAAX protease family)